MNRFLILLFIIKSTMYCQQIEDMVACNDVGIDQQEFDQMTLKEQEDYVK
jgi:hypothetical protein